MAETKCVDHKGTEFPSFEAMCKHWDKTPDTVRERLGKWTPKGDDRSLADSPLELALEIPEIPGYEFELEIIGLDGKYRFSVRIKQNYVQHDEFDSVHTAPKGCKWGEIYTLEQIKNNFPMTKKQFIKGQLLGIY